MQSLCIYVYTMYYTYVSIWLHFFGKTFSLSLSESTTISIFIYIATNRHFFTLHAILLHSQQVVDVHFDFTQIFSLQAVTVDCRHTLLFVFFFCKISWKWHFYMNAATCTSCIFCVCIWMECDLCSSQLHPLL